MRAYSQGTFVPRNPQKYVGDVSKIIFRSSWEKKLMLFFDSNKDVIKWGSEETTVRYYSPVDKKIHTYYLDFTVMYKNADGEIKREIIEVKPYAQTLPPKKRKQTKQYINEVMTYATNDAKWKAAREWALDNGFVFKIITERDLGL
jgi:hypothetical protein